jgi:hypothetical protein
MKTITKLGLIGAAAAYALAFVLPASAAPLTCPDGGDRTVTIDGDGTYSCGPSGDTTDQPEGQYFSDAGYTLLEKINDGDGVDGGDYIILITGLGGTSGTFELAPGITGGVLVFKFGSGNISPDWISFYFDGLTSGTWSVDPAQQALSHVTLYGEYDTPRDVPEPTTLALMGLGLVAVGYRMRRRQVA